MRLAKRISSAAEPRTWVTVPGRRVEGLRPHGLNRIDDQKPGRNALRQRCHDVLDRGFGSDFDQRVGQPKPFRAQPDLRHRFFARDIDGAVTAAGEGCRRLKQQRRFADAGIAAKKQNRPAHQAAAGNAIELGDAGGEPRRVLRFTFKRLDGEQSSLA